MTSNKAILEVQEVVMQFGGLRAIDNVSFTLMKPKSLG
jgi:branched-chain amino acid transport system ATP-binding protein